MSQFSLVFWFCSFGLMRQVSLFFFVLFLLLFFIGFGLGVSDGSIFFVFLVLFFLVLVWGVSDESIFFVCFGFGLGVSDESILFVVFGFGFWFGSVWWIHGYLGNSFEKTFHYQPLVSTIFVRKRLSPKYFRQFMLNFFLWRPDSSKGSSLLSLKTGLFQREVASSIRTNRLSVKQDCVRRGTGN